MQLKNREFLKTHCKIQKEYKKITQGTTLEIFTQLSTLHVPFLGYLYTPLYSWVLSLSQKAVQNSFNDLIFRDFLQKLRYFCDRCVAFEGMKCPSNPLNNESIEYESRKFRHSNRIAPDFYDNSLFADFKSFLQSVQRLRYRPSFASHFSQNTFLLKGIDIAISRSRYKLVRESPTNPLIL